jgi:hypothetical protein
MNICTVLCCLNRTSFKDVISTPWLIQRHLKSKNLEWRVIEKWK